MSKSTVIKLVLLNSLLVPGCSSKRQCDADPKEQGVEGAQAGADCRGSRSGYYRSGGRGIYIFPSGGSGGGRSGAPTSSVGRGGFGGSGHAAS